MSELALRVEGLGKQYRLGGTPERYVTLRERLSTLASAPFQALRGRRKSSEQEPEFWALKDVSFDVTPGEVVGVIGRNGAGKSTLLKVLSRITEPTEGAVDINGRVGSLLEVGTGFHPELTGRENVYLNGAILGMKRADITRRFDDIVSFAEIEKFIDSPTKHYSSGMYMRLAFAVAAHLEPEILIVDEVLAVGDSEFQRKCLGKMRAISREGRTVLFVSHNMAAIQRLCERAIVMEAGLAVFDAPINEALNFNYRRNRVCDETAVADLTTRDGPGRSGDGAARFLRFELRSLDRELSSELLFGQPFTVTIAVESTHHITNPLIGFSFLSSDDTEVIGTSAHDCGLNTDLRPGRQDFECVVDPMILTPGLYHLRAAIFQKAANTIRLHDYIDHILTFRVGEASANLDVTPHGHYVGHVFVKYAWKVA
jgi:lipopolysaccharide transport system ATP-binding protein